MSLIAIEANNPSIFPQASIIGPNSAVNARELFQPEAVKDLPWFDPRRFLPSTYVDVQPPFVRPDSNFLADPLATFNQKVGKDINFQSKAEGDFKGVGNVAYNTGDVDSLMAAAEKLLASDKLSDQQRGMLLMQKANQIHNLFVELHKMKTQQALSAIQGINAR